VPALAGARRFQPSVQRQQAGLAHDAIDQPDLFLGDPRNLICELQYIILHESPLGLSLTPPKNSPLALLAVFRDGVTSHGMVKK